MDETALLAAIQSLRSNLAYHQAETRRRNFDGGAAAMASTAAGSAEHGAILLLINTWEAIAVLLADAGKKDRIFEILPVSHMYRELGPAIDVLAKRCSGFGLNFGKLLAEYEAWLKKKKRDAQYVSCAQGGMHAMFG